ncbi:MAG: hypothetical protein HYZ14_08750 [Bacteroidetes bacterium]|nr:hypothetical protein [Bacteroidota bacterium]
MNCKKATELVEKGFIQPLTLKEFLALRVHLSLCSDCKNYKHYSVLLEKAIRPKTDHEHDIAYRLTDAQKEEIKLKLNQSMEDKSKNSGM